MSSNEGRSFKYRTNFLIVYNGTRVAKIVLKSPVHTPLWHSNQPKKCHKPSVASSFCSSQQPVSFPQRVWQSTLTIWLQVPSSLNLSQHTVLLSPLFSIPNQTHPNPSLSNQIIPHVVETMENVTIPIFIQVRVWTQRILWHVFLLWTNHLWQETIPHWMISMPISFPKSSWEVVHVLPFWKLNHCKLLHSHWL